MDEIYRFHHDMAYATIAINLFAGMWMLFSLKYKHLQRNKRFFWPVYLGWITIVIQAFLGVSVYMSGYEVGEGKGFHYFYGFLLFAIATVIWSYRNQLSNKRVLIYGISSLFIGAMGLRTALLVLL